MTTVSAGYQHGKKCLSCPLSHKKNDDVSESRYNYKQIKLNKDSPCKHQYEIFQIINI